MIEATNKLRDEDLQDIKFFEEKIQNEYKKFKNSLKNLNSEQVFNKSYKISFMKLLKKYLLTELSLNEMRDLQNEYDLMEKCYKAFKEYIFSPEFSFDFIFEMRNILDLALEEI